MLIVLISKSNVGTVPIRRFLPLNFDSEKEENVMCVYNKSLFGLLYGLWEMGMMTD